MEIPDDAPESCPVCGAAYDSVSVHEGGLTVNLIANERYRRVCFDPVEWADGSGVQFYHHTHAQVRDGRGAEGATGTEVL